MGKIINNLNVTSPIKIGHNDYESLINECFKKARPFIYDNINKGYAQENVGNIEKAECYYRAANYYYTLIYYTALMKSYFDKISKIEKDPNCTVRERFQFDCVRKSLVCISKVDSNLQKYFEDILLEVFGLANLMKPCGTYLPDSCVGIGGMIVGETVNFNKSNMVGKVCSIFPPTPPSPPPSGEFKVGEFFLNSFTENVY